YIKIEWDHGSDISVELPQLLQVIDDFLERREGNEQVLVACNQGVSRSASLVIACVMRRRGLGLMEAYDYVKGKNEFISPNVGLLGQLALFQE
ncbi:dual specificity phosphatase, partial [Obelidium mucronatum]